MNQINNPDFTIQLQRLWSIESQLVEAMPRMVEKTSALGLEKNLAMHFEETRQHKVAIEAICKQLDIDAKAGEPDAGLQHILQQGEQTMMQKAQGDEIDTAIIEAALQIEQYEMEAYQPVGEMAASLGYIGIAQRLMLTFEEERQSNTKLQFLYKSLFTQTADIGQLEMQNEALRPF